MKNDKYPREDYWDADGRYSKTIAKELVSIFRSILHYDPGTMLVSKTGKTLMKIRNYEPIKDMAEDILLELRDFLNNLQYKPKTECEACKVLDRVLREINYRKNAICDYSTMEAYGSNVTKELSLEKKKLHELEKIKDKLKDIGVI